MVYKILLTCFLLYLFYMDLSVVIKNKDGQWLYKELAIGGVLGLFFKYGIIFLLLYVGNYYKN